MRGRVRGSYIGAGGGSPTANQRSKSKLVSRLHPLFRKSNIGQMIGSRTVVMLLVAGSLMVGAAPAAAEPTYLSEERLSTGIREMPTYLAWTDDTWIDDVTWTGWGEPSAEGTGLMDSLYMEPTPVHIVLTERSRCAGRLMYTNGFIVGVDLVTGDAIGGQLALGCRVSFVMGSNGYITDLDQLVKPRRFQMGELLIEHMRWSKWNRPVVSGYGTYRDPTSKRTKQVRFRLSKPGYCPALYTTIYLRYRIQFKRHGSWHGSTASYRSSCENG